MYFQALMSIEWKMNASQNARTYTYLPFPSFRAISSCKKSFRFSSFFSRNSIVSLTTFRKNVDTFRGVRGSFRAIATDGTRVYSNPIILPINDSSTNRLPHCRNSASGYFRQLHWIPKAQEAITSVVNLAIISW